MHNQPTKHFTYSDIIDGKVHYKHDNSETTIDNIDLEVVLLSQQAKLLKPWTTICNIPVHIIPVNDPPKLSFGSDSESLKITGKSKLLLNSQVISLWDADSDPDTVKVTVTDSYGVRLMNSVGKEIKKFTQREFLNNDVYIIQEGMQNHGTMKLVADDGDRESNVIELTINTVPVEIQLKANSGLEVVHQTAAIISPENLTFTTNFPGLPVEYTIVNLPEYGAIECRQEMKNFEICTKFTQNDIDSSRVQYKHSSAAHSTFDFFSFQVRVDNTTSVVHTFRITFIPVHVKIFNRVPFLLNNTDNLTLKRVNLFAWTYPKSFPTNQLVYHIIEPPKFGTLLRRIDKSRNRRIGVSSNFTQKHIDNEEISYKMHFIQHSVINDFFIFRLITPSVTSESVRFEVTFIPGFGSIQLINRTVIVDEGGIQKITNESLSLRTPDDNSFLFVIGAAPSYGSILLNKLANEQYELAEGDNFTTFDVNNQNVFYKHWDGENRIDRILLLAESNSHRANRIPFWLTIGVILKNDNIPKLTGSNVIEITERGDRILHPFLLPWKDEDINSPPLLFTFHDTFEYATILSKLSPNITKKNFTQKEMKNGEIIIRHLGPVKRLEMKYTVSDGVHEISSELIVVASEPFLEVRNNSIMISSTTPSLLSTVLITKHNLSAATNIDSKRSDIVFRVASKNWILVVNSTEKFVSNFTQEDIDEGRIFYRVNPFIEGSMDEEILITVITAKNLSLIENFKISRNYLDKKTSVLELITLKLLIVPLSSISPIDKSILLAKALNKEPTEIIFDVIKQPTHGSLILETVKAANNGLTVMPSSFFVSRFTQAHVNAKQIQYLHNDVLPVRDSIVFNVSVEDQMIGPFTLFIKVVDDEIDLSVSNMTVTFGLSKVINNAILRATTTSDNESEFRIFSNPEFGWIVRDSWNLANISSIRQFNNQELRDLRVHYVNDPKSRQQLDSFTVAACTIGTLRCTEPKQVFVMIKYQNFHEPELLRNEVLKMWNTSKARITKQHLFSQDDDTSAQQIRYIINQPLNGYIARINNPLESIANFSQAEISDSQIVFIKNKGSTSAGGFSFLVSDGLHQIGPEWFTIDISPEMKAGIQTNNRLVIPPGQFPVIISSDLLKAQLPNASLFVKPHEITYSVSKIPRYGHLLLSGIPTQKFTQEDINNRRLVYKLDIGFLDEWTKRDMFLFKIFIENDTFDESTVIDEHRFKISITYAALPSNRIHEFVQLENITVTNGGSLAINKSHINMKFIWKNFRDELLVNFPRKPRYGHLDLLNRIANHTDLMKLTQLLSGRSLIYRHQKSNMALTDEIFINILPRNDASRRTNRLRIEAFPDRINLVTGKDYLLSSNIFRLTHPEIKPSNLEYRLIQVNKNLLFNRPQLTVPRI
ncbi:unnamed protein product [Thelazia callipaeda]|uniref:Cadherin domain-containing protein n=1 Tax=Thelazia callipaeda TaxID=103827 RepID=A0A0N5CQW0_THECL|nr:unnamed protein product [Thelazia callipaeda]